MTREKLHTGPASPASIACVPERGSINPADEKIPEYDDWAPASFWSAADDSKRPLLPGPHSGD